MTKTIYHRNIWTSQKKGTFAATLYWVLLHRLFLLGSEQFGQGLISNGIQQGLLAGCQLGVFFPKYVPKTRSKPPTRLLIIWWINHGKSMMYSRYDHPIELMEQSCRLNRTPWGWIGRGWCRVFPGDRLRTKPWIIIPHRCIATAFGNVYNAHQHVHSEGCRLLFTRAEHLNCYLIPLPPEKSQFCSLRCGSKWIKMVPVLSFEVAFLSVALCSSPWVNEYRVPLKQCLITCIQVFSYQTIFLMGYPVPHLQTHIWSMILTVTLFPRGRWSLASTPGCRTGLKGAKGPHTLQLWDTFGIELIKS